MNARLVNLQLVCTELSVVFAFLQQQISKRLFGAAIFTDKIPGNNQQRDADENQRWRAAFPSFQLVLVITIGYFRLSLKKHSSMLVTGTSAGFLFCFIDRCATAELTQRLVEAVVYPGTEYNQERGRLCEEYPGTEYYQERGRLCEEVLVDLWYLRVKFVHVRWEMLA